MEILEFGDRNKRKIIFIHGFQCPYQIWEKYIEHYQKDYHIIIPIMPGHNPKKQEKFFSFLQTSRELGAVDKVVSENLQWEFEQKKRRPPASFHGPYQPLQVQRGR